MGNTRSSTTDEFEDIWWTNAVSTTNKVNQQNQSCNSSDFSLNQPNKTNRQNLDDFQIEFDRKREKRRQILDEKRKEMQDLREEVETLKKENQKLKQSKTVIVSDDETSSSDEIDKLRKENEELKRELEQKRNELEKSEIIIEKNRELKINIAEMQKELQNLNTEIINFEKEREDYQAHVVALKDVIAVSKQMIMIRENQLKELKEKVDSIEASLAGREMNILSQDLRNEYERQLQNIRNLRTLYEERQRADRREKLELESKVEDAKKEVEVEQKKNSELVERMTELETENSKKYDEIKALESNLGLTKAECRQYQQELTVINQLFSEILLGFNNSQDIDLDKLTKHLEDHHDLLQNIVVNEVSTEVSSVLPKILLDLVNQVNGKENNTSEENGESEVENEENKKLDTIEEETDTATTSLHQLNSPQEIVENLPKVWRVLIELLSHQTPPTNNLTEDDEDQNTNPCYKLVQTPKGPSLVLSVSQTFIRLKDLILEKKSLEKETNHLKQLNGHLETRLQDQEKRLELVTSELSKTWHVVGKLQKQHQMLHTQEKILRYELAQKRKLLNELKEELEYSREKSLQAKQKNSSTEEQWRQLRNEFASRKNTVTDDFNNSVESGYSDERECSSDDEPGYETDISECNPKSSDDIDSPSESQKDAESSNTILNLIQDQINEIVQSEVNTEPVHSAEENQEPTSSSSASNEEVIHSDHSTKTESVQSETSEEKTNDIEECTNVDSSSTATTANLLELSPREDVKSTQSEDCCNSRLNSPTEDCGNREVIQNSEPSTSTSSEKPKRTLEEVLKAREERLRRLEGQCSQLVTKVTNTNTRSVAISTKLDNLHEVYGENSNSRATGDDVVPSNVDVEDSSIDNDNINGNDNQE